MAHLETSHLIALLTTLTYSSTVTCTAGTVFIPTSNQTVPFDSFGNVTYNCEVDDNRTLIWEVSGASIQSNSTAMQFEAVGIIKEDRGATQSMLIITSAAREAYMRKPISVRCSAFNSNPPGTTFSNLSYVVTYGIPESPGNLILTASGTYLTLNWSPPANVPQGVPVTYCVTITSRARSNQTCNITTTSFTFPENNQASCEMFQFSVTASNPAGDSVPTIIQDTIPISADLRNASRELIIDYINLTRGREVFIQVSFPPARTCSTRFPVTNYSVNVLGVGSVTIGNSNSSRVVIPVNTTTIPGLVQDRRYSLTISACIEITCRESQNTTTLFTTDVQNPRVRYVGTNLNLSLTCDFAEKSTAEGCLFNFTGINTEPQSFLVNRVGDSPTASACAMANAVADDMNYMWSAFDDISGVPITVELIAVDSQDNFECLPMRPDQGATGQSPGDINVGGVIGGVLGALLLLAVVIVIVIVVVILIVKKKSRITKVEDSGQSETHVTVGPLSKQEGGSNVPDCGEMNGEGVEETVFHNEDEPLLTCTMRVLCHKRGTVQFITKYNKEAIKKKIRGDRGEVTVQLVPTIK